MQIVTQYRKLYILLIISLISSIAFSQNRSNDFGIFLGTSQYNGDVNMSKPYYKPHFTGALLYRKTYNHYFSWRFGLSYGELQGTDKDFDNEYQQHRDYTFEDNNLYEFSSVLEFNFLELTADKDEYNYTPYVIGGLAIFNASEIKWNEMVTIPLGLGFKYKFADNYEISIEWAFRKTSTDKLDLLDENSVGYKQQKQFSFNSNNDWYSLLGATFMINFLGNNSPCGIYEKKRYEYFKKRKHR